MLLAELLKDDVENSLYCKTKDYYIGDDGEQIQYKGYLISKLKGGSKYFVFKNNNPVVFSNSISNYFDTVEIAKKIIDEGEKKINGDSYSQFCKTGDVGGRQIIFRYKLDGEVKTIKMPVREILRYSNKNASEAATRYLSENFPGAKLIDVGLGHSTDSCKVGDVAFGVKGISKDSKSMDFTPLAKQIGVEFDKWKRENYLQNTPNDKAIKQFIKEMGLHDDEVRALKSLYYRGYDSCKVGDVAFGGKGYRCVKCHATADSVHKIVHVKDDNESKLYEIENEVSKIAEKNNNSSKQIEELFYKKCSAAGINRSVAEKYADKIW